MIFCSQTNDKTVLIEECNALKSIVKQSLVYQKNKRKILRQCLDEICYALEVLVDINNINNLSLLLRDLKSILTLSDYNIDTLTEIKHYLNDLDTSFLLTKKNAMDIIQKKVADFNTNYSSVEETILLNSSMIESFILRFIQNCNLSFDNTAKLTSTNPMASTAYLKSQKTHNIETLLENLRADQKLDFELKTQADNQSEIQSNQEFDSNQISKLNSEIKSEFESNYDTEVKFESKSNYNFELEPKLGSEINPKLDLESNTEFNLETKSEFGAESGFKFETEDSLEDNNTLLISEKDAKVYLPYKADDVLDIFYNSSNTYDNLDDVISKEYTVPLSRYKNPSKARFREAFNLMKYKEHSSFFNALSLALELHRNNSLNPAIITACNDLDELDTYLDYLDSNELDKFPLFNVIFESLPIKK